MVINEKYEVSENIKAFYKKLQEFGCTVEQVKYLASIDERKEIWDTFDNPITNILIDLLSGRELENQD